MGSKKPSAPAEHRKRLRFRDKTIGKGARAAKMKFDDASGIVKKTTFCYTGCGLKVEYYAHKDDRPLRKICDHCKEYGAPGERFHNMPSLAL